MDSSTMKKGMYMLLLHGYLLVVLRSQMPMVIRRVTETASSSGAKLKLRPTSRERLIPGLAKG